MTGQLTESGRCPVGVLLAGIAPSRIPDVAREAEELGFGSVWAPEDYPQHPASVIAAMAAVATTEIVVGTGVVSLATRHPVVVAMEAAALADAAPGRIRVGVGLGLPATLEPLGCLPTRPLAHVREHTQVVRELLTGATVTRSAPGLNLTGVSLDHPPDSPPPLYLGALGPRMLELAGALADGVIISSLGTEAYLRQAVERIDKGRSDRNRPMPALTAFAWYHLADDDAAGRDALRGTVGGALGALGPGPLTDADGWSNNLDQRRQSSSPNDLAPDHWLDEMVVAGDPDRCTAGILRRLRAGADAVVVCPMGADPMDQIRRTAEVVLPAVNAERRAGA